MKKITLTLAKATLALALTTGGTALYAQDTTTPDTAAPDKPAPAEPMPAEPAPPTPPPADPAPAPVDEDGDGMDDLTGEPTDDTVDDSPEG